jgi:HEAT repeat protein
VKCLAGIAEECPIDVVDAAPALAALLADRASGLEFATYTLVQIAKAQPSAIEPVTQTLREAIADESLSDYARMMAISALGRVVSDAPSEAVDIIDDLVALLDAEDPMLKNNAVGLISDIALVHTDAVEPHADAIASLLTVDEDDTRVNASCALARVAEDFPESVEYLTPRFLRLLTDSEAVVRANACRALGHLRAQDAEGALEGRLRDDADPDVHRRAEWALNRIQG